MKLWLLKWNEAYGGDVFTRAVVAAPTETIARRLHPNGSSIYKDGQWGELGKDTVVWKAYGYVLGDWPADPSVLEVKPLGNAVKGTKTGVVLGEYHVYFMGDGDA